MVIGLLRGRNQDYSILDQQSFLLSYAQERGLAIDMTELDNSPYSTDLEERELFLELLKTLRPKDVILVYSIDVLSKKVGELVKIFDCVLKHDISLHLCSEKIVINSSLGASFLFDLLSRIREGNRNHPMKTRGRPKGSFSKSKFDPYKQEIMTKLEQNLSVSQIAKDLGVSRSSLKDYINSRSLKELVNLQDVTQGALVINHEGVSPSSKTCPLTGD